MQGRRAGPLSATALGVLAGAFGGAAAGLLDHALGAGGAAQFLPDGSGRLLVFLVALYGATAAAAGAAAGLLLSLLARYTDLGALADGAPAGEGPPLEATGALAPTPGSPTEAPGPAGAARPATEPATAAMPAPTIAAQGRSLLAYGMAVAAALAVHGLWMREATRFVLRRFHSPMLRAALLGAEAAAMAIPLALGVLLLAALLGQVLRGGPHLRTRLAVAPGAATLGGTFGLGLAAGAVAQLLAALQRNRRLGDEARALNAGLWSPLLVLAALALAWVAVRALAPRLPRAARALLELPGVAVLAPLALAGLGGAGLLAATWSVARLLPLRALGVGLFAPTVALLGLVGLWRRPRARGAVLGLGAPARAAVVALVPLALLGVALQAGRADRVRKAASIHASLSGPILDGIHLAWDLDHDGFSPLLGADCDDFDAEVHPGAFDWPDDGIDQNCNGHQATLQVTPRPPFAPLPDAVPRRPNILLITVDALRWDHVGAYGYGRPTTPRIDELARESTLFENGWAHSPSTRYSVPAILTGRYESTIAWGNDHWPPTVLPENRLIPEMLHENGYRTAAILPVPYLLPRSANAPMSMWGLDQGFDEYDTSLAHLHGNAGGDPAKATGSSARQAGDLGVRWIEAHAAKREERPFFLWMHFYDPHFVHEPHPDCAPCQFGGAQPSEVDLYDGEVRFTDQHIGRVLDALRASGAWDDTVVLLSADHGEGFGEHGVKLHGYHIYTAQNRVPFLVKVPGLAPRHVAEPVGHIDLFPTLLNLMRLPDEPQLLGRSFADLLLGGGPPRLVFQEVDYEGPTQRKAVASRTHQLIANVIPDGTYEYYDLEHDPLEAHDRFVRGAGGEQGRLFTALGEWMDESALPRDFASRVAGNLARQPFPFERTIGADLGGLLTVAGVSAPGEARAGDTVAVELVYQVPARIPKGWHLFTHARTPQGGFVNLDHEPVEGFVPLASLRPGQWVRDRVRLALPPAWRGTTVSIDVGLFNGGQRAPVKLPVGPPGDHINVAVLRVLP